MNALENIVVGSIVLLFVILAALPMSGYRGTLWALPRDVWRVLREIGEKFGKK